MLNTASASPTVFVDGVRYVRADENTDFASHAAAPASVTILKADAREVAFSARPDQLGHLHAQTSIVVFSGDKAYAKVAIGEPVLFYGLVPGADYGIYCGPDGNLFGVLSEEAGQVNGLQIGGFHYAPGGNATEFSGGDATPAVNPYSFWDLNFRPACPDPRGMALIDGKFWADIYLLGINPHTDGTSRYGAVIADGRSLPYKSGDTERYAKLDYATAGEIYAAFGKQIPSVTEFFALAEGVTERTAADGEPGATGLDAPRTSKFGIMQATGNMWIWGHDGTPGKPRASIFGGSWLSDEDAGSRHASLGYWHGYSVAFIGARGRSDHLVLA